MSLKNARKYLLISRILIPLGALYLAGWAIGDVLYRSTGHLGLFDGPLGELREAIVMSRRHYSAVSAPTWAILIPLAAWLAVLAVELRHQRRRPLRGRGLVLIIGYCLGAASMAAPLVAIRRGGPPFGPEALIGMMAFSGFVLAIGAWPSWGMRARVAAPLLCTAGILLSLWVFRAQDRRLLSQDWPQGSQQDERPSDNGLRLSSRSGRMAAAHR